MDRHGRHRHAHIGGQAHQQVPSEQGRQVEHQAGDGDGGHADDEADQLHHHLEQAGNDKLQLVGGLAADHDQTDSEKQGEDHHRQDLVLGRRGHRVRRDELQEKLRRRNLPRGVVDDRLGAASAVGKQLVRQSRVDPVAGAQPVHHADADDNSDRRDHDGQSQRLQPDTAQRLQIAHLRHADHQGGKQQRHHQHEQQAQEDLADGPGDVRRQPLNPGGIRSDAEVDPKPAGKTDGESEQHQGVERNTALLRVHETPIRPAASCRAPPPPP